MIVTSNEEFAKRMVLMAGPVGEFKPTATYDPDGDSVEFLAKPDPFYAERIDDLVTVYYSQETGELIGSLIKGVENFCRDILVKLPGFQIVIHDHPVSLKYIFLAKLWSDEPRSNDLHTLTYQKLIEISDEAKIEGDLCFSR